MTNKNCGIYKITNTVTGKFYIGSAVNIKQRWSVHRCQLSANTHSNRHLQNSWNKHGEDSFTFEVLEYCEKERLIEREQFYIDNEKPAYNISPTAGNSLGVKHTDDTKRKVSEAKKGFKHTDESKRKISEARKGKVKSDETKRKISEANKGEKHAMYGKHHTDETKRKMSEAMKRYWAERLSNE